MGEWVKENWKMILLHTNDSHGHVSPIQSVSQDICSQLQLCNGMMQMHRLGGFAYLAGMVHTIRKENPYVMLLDSGDMFADTMAANLTKGRLQVSLMNNLGYDAMCPGNHDIDYGVEELKKISKEARFPILAANLIDQDTNKPYLGKPYRIKEINGLKIGIYGLTYHLTPETTVRKNIKKVRYTLDFEQIQKDICNIREEGAELIVVLSHLGAPVDEKLAQKVRGINVILGGHSHDPIGIKKIHGVVLAQAPPHLTGLGYLELNFNIKQLVSVEGKIIPILSEKVEADREIDAMIKKLQRNHIAERLAAIGYSFNPIVRNYMSESPIETLLGNSMRLFTQSDVSILPGVGYGVTIVPGKVTAEQMTNFFPHESAIYTGYLKGRDILAALEQSIENQTHPDVTQRVGGLIQTTGLQFVYTYKEGDGNHIYKVTVGGRPLQKDQFYRVVMNELMKEGGHKYRSLKNAIHVTKLPWKDVDFVKNWYQWYSPSYASIQGWSIPMTDEDVRKGEKKCFPLK